MEFEPVIGLEVHAQLKTKTKIFCGCPTEFGKGPNEQVCVVCAGMPGALPVLNRKAVECAIKAGLALNCHIAETTKFDRKNYFYPDSPKGYQISQLDDPICSKGHLLVNEKRIRINRAHLEEDAGKLVHAGAAGLHGSDYSNADYNRCGVPLLEIVSEPDIESPEEAQQYLIELRNILRYIDVCDGNLEEGSFRCDANVSIKPKGDSKLGTRTEIKNMNSFKAVQRAIQSEIERQTKLLNQGERIVQETRLWNDADQTTHPMRSKEDSHDYRYFPEPDLVPLQIGREWVSEMQAGMPELPEARRQRYVGQHALSAYDAGVLAESKELSDFFDKTLTLGTDAKQAANYLINQTLGYMKDKKLEFADTKITPQNIHDLAELTGNRTLNSTTATKLLQDLLETAGDVHQIVKDRSLAQISDEAGLKDAVAQVLADSQSQVEEYKKGRTKVRQYFLGAVMKATRGKADPQVINKLLDELLPSPEEQ